MTLPRATRRLPSIEVFLGRDPEPIEADVGLDGFIAEVEPKSTHTALAPGATLEGAIAVGEQLFPFAGEVRWIARVDTREAHQRFAVRITWVADEYFRALRATWTEAKGSG
jgi:hypothetical protein